MNSADCQRCVKATLTLILIYFRGIMRVIMKIEMREIKFSCGVIAWNFLLIFYFSKIKSFGHSKVRFQEKNKKIWQATVIYLAKGNFSILQAIWGEVFNPSKTTFYSLVLNLTLSSSTKLQYDSRWY